MSPIDVTNLLMKLVTYKNTPNQNGLKTNINQNSYLNQNQNTNNNLKPSVSNQPIDSFVQSQQQANSNINLNNNIYNILNRELVNRQSLNNVIQRQYSTQNSVYAKQNNLLPQYNTGNNYGVNAYQNVNNIINQYVINNQNIVNAQQKGIVENFFANRNASETAPFTKIQHQALSGNISTRLASVNQRNQNIVIVKEMMNLPQEMDEVLALVQNQIKNVQNKNVQQGNGINLSNINIKTLTQLIQTGGKEALTQVMNASSAQKLTKAEINHIQEAISSLSASSSSQESQTQALKNFMLLYLPWLPLEEGMDFELDFSFSEGSEESDENILNIIIMTKHFGEIHILIILKTICSFEIYIQCCKNFPKNILLKLVGDDERKHAIQSNYVFEEQSKFEPKNNSGETKITLSNVNEISPFLLLIANSLIKNTLLLDSKFGERI